MTKTVLGVSGSFNAFSGHSMVFDRHSRDAPGYPRDFWSVEERSRKFDGVSTTFRGYITDIR